jgi:hypothetical protein
MTYQIYLGAGFFNGTPASEISTSPINIAKNTPVFSQLHLSTPNLVALARKNSTNVNEKATRRKSINFKDTGDLAFDKLIRSYETAVHYTKQDLKNMGRDIVRSIFQFTNLSVPLIPSPPPSVKSPGSGVKLRYPPKEQVTHIPPETDSIQTEISSIGIKITGIDHVELQRRVSMTRENSTNR